METPLTWPALDFNSILENLKYATPSEYFIYDGLNFYMNSANASRNLDVKGLSDTVKQNFDLPHKIWFGTNFEPGTKTELIKSNDETNQIGLLVEFNSSVSPNEQERHEEYYWFDPQRQDMPVKKLSRTYSSDQKIKFEFNTVYMDYSQLPDGTWYPTCWQTHSAFEGTKQETREFRLTLIPDYEIEEDWFKPPRE